MQAKGKTIKFEVTPARIRNAANVGVKRDLSTGDAEKFIELFGGEIEDALAGALQGVLKRHFGLGGGK